MNLAPGTRGKSVSGLGFLRVRTERLVDGLVVVFLVLFVGEPWAPVGRRERGSEAAEAVRPVSGSDLGRSVRVGVDL